MESWLLNHRFGKYRKSVKRRLSVMPKKARVKRYELTIPFSSKLVFSFRRFKTAPERRSVRFKQYVFQPKHLPYREIAVAFKPAKKSKRRTVLAPTSFARTVFSLPMALITLGMLGSIFFGLHIYKPVTINLSKPVAAATESAQPAPAKPVTLPHSEPEHISIPAIDIDTEVVPTGLKADGGLALPNQFDVTAWYTGGPAPGDLGPAVIAGHVDSTHGIAIFWRLRELMPGDTIQIGRADGTTATFTVTDLQQYPQDNFPTQAVYGDIDYAGLRLITCGGTFSTQTGHYSDNTVVYARLTP